ncbi:MAG: radical SAM protein, partial [Nitrospinota bacterium]|nr:radical SAM protein [Nitrospinota bacterium]
MSLDKLALAALDMALEGRRLGEDQAEALFTGVDLLSLGRAAAAARWRIKPEPIVTYIVDRNINYTNVCVSGCRFCAFYRTQGDEDAYTLSPEEMDLKVEQTKALGGSQILLQGGMSPGKGLEWSQQMIRRIKEKNDIHIHAFSPPEIIHMAKTSRMSLREAIGALMEAGLDSIPGGGAEILSDRVRRRISPGKCSADEWIEVMRVAHQMGLKTTATMMFGHLETYGERVESMM